MKRAAFWAAAAALLFSSLAHAQVPQLLNYQGRVAVGTPPVNFDGAGFFKFALVDASGTTTYWSNSPDTAPADGVPDTAVTLNVTKGLYSVLLGDTQVPGMTLPIPAGVWTHEDVRLRVWFDDGAHGSQLLTPDQRIAAVGYALMAGSVPDGTITTAKIAGSAVDSTRLAPNLMLSGTTTGNFAGGGTTAFQSVAGTSQIAAANTNYLLTNAAMSTVTLPAAPAVGDVVRINGVGAGGWQAAPNSGQSIVGLGTTGALAGATWTPRESNRPWVGIASSADGSKLVASADNGQLYNSTDSGVTWTARESNRFWRHVASSSDGTKLVAVAAGDRIYTSGDSGMTWTPRESVRNWWSVASSSDGTKLVAGVSGGQLYTSTDSGVTWTPRESSRSWLGVASSSDGTKLLAAAGQGGQLYTSTNSGATWTARESARFWLSVASSSDGTKLVAGVDGGQLYASTDSGVTWTARESTRQWFGIASSADGTKLAAADSGGQLYISTNSGVTWTARDSVRTWWAVASSSDGSKLAATVNGGRIYTSTATTTPIPLAGAAGTTTALQYIGSDQWQALTEANAASANSVAAANITGTVSGAQIAAGAVGSTQLASGLTLGGTTTGTFSGTLAGNATSATTAGGFTGVLAGDVSGTQGATVVSRVGAVSAANVAAGASLALGATNTNTANTIVKRDGSGNFSAGTITATLAAGSVTSTQIASGAVGTGQIADRSIGAVDIAQGVITRDLLAPLGQAVSASSGTFSTTTRNADIDVTNLSVSVTTTGRPVMVALVSDGAAASTIGRLQSSSTAAWRFFPKFWRNGGTVATYVISGTDNAAFGAWGVAHPPTFFHIDVPPAGTHTYKFTIQFDDTGSPVQPAIVHYSKLLVYEL